MINPRKIINFSRGKTGQPAKNVILGRASLYASWNAAEKVFMKDLQSKEKPFCLAYAKRSIQGLLGLKGMDFSLRSK